MYNYDFVPKRRNCGLLNLWENNVSSEYIFNLLKGFGTHNEVSTMNEDVWKKGIGSYAFNQNAELE